VSSSVASASRRSAAASVATDRNGPRHPDRAGLLRKALDEPTDERHASVDPHERAARDPFAVVAAGDDDEEFLVLSPDGIKKLVTEIRARLPVHEDRRRSTEIVTRLELGRQERTYGLGIRLVFDDQEVARVVPRRGRHERRAPCLRKRKRVPGEPRGRVEGHGREFTSRVHADLRPRRFQVGRARDAHAMVDAPAHRAGERFAGREADRHLVAAGAAVGRDDPRGWARC
jgi:hypothetical protein